MELRLPTPDGGTRPGWSGLWHICMPGLPHPRPGAVPPNSRALVLVCQCPRHVPRGKPVAIPPPVQVCIKRGDRYQPVDAARLDLDHHRVTLTPPGGLP